MVELPKTPSFRLDNRHSLVCGASSGIGLACAVALAEAGSQVTLVARREAELSEATRAINEAGYSAHYQVLDITDIDNTRRFLADRHEFDILVNSAGMARHSQAIDTRVQDYDAVMDVNLKAAYFLSAEFARNLKSGNKAGSIINISSQMAHVGGVDRAVYCASKHALEGMTKSMAIEWGADKIRINTICPTFIRTELAEQTLKDPERVNWILSKIKLGRIGEVEDVMGAVVFLSSDAASMITGTSILIDGGWTAG